MQQEVPGRVFGEELFLGRFLAREFDDIALRAAANFEENGDGLCGIEGAVWVVIRKLCKEPLEFGAFGGERIPRIAVAVVDHRASAKDLLETRGILADNGDDQVQEFAELKGLFHDRAHAEIAGVFVGITDGDLLRKRHR